MKSKLKIVVVSDNHGDIETLDKIYFTNQDADLFLHCGDSLLFPQNLYQFVSVQGNCDYPNLYKETRRIKTAWGDIFMEHGLKLTRIGLSYAITQNPFIYLYGHTHCHKLERLENGTYLLNPGSTTRPRDGTSGTYAIIVLSDDEPQFIFKEVV